MIQGPQSYAFHAGMKKHNLGARTNMRMQPDQGGIRMFAGLREHVCGAIRSIMKVRKITGKLVLFFMPA